MNFLKRLKQQLHLGAVFFFFLSKVYAAEDPLPDKTIKTVLEPSPYVSARSASLAGVLSTSADGLHAPYYNPAGIGGIHWEKNKPPSIRLLSFPYLGVAVNEASTKLLKEFDQTSASTDRAIGQAIVDANAGKRQYMRFSGLLSFGVGRILALQATDTQIAAFKSKGTSSEEGGIDAAYTSLSTTGIGASITDPSEQIYLGAFISHLNLKSFNGEITYDQIIQQKKRSDAIGSRQQSYEGLTSNIGMIWIFHKKLRPTLGICVRNVGDTSLKSSSSSSEASYYVMQEDLNLGFSLSPRLGKNSSITFTMEGSKLSHKDVSVNKKFKSAIEWNYAGFGSEAILGVRAGYNLAGVSFGASINLNLIQLEIASQAEDIGIENRHVAERRNVAIFSVNVTDT